MYKSGRGDGKITIKQEYDNNCAVYSGDEFIALSKICSGEELQPTLGLRFENGSSGTGAWDLTELFCKY